MAHHDAGQMGETAGNSITLPSIGNDVSVESRSSNPARLAVFGSVWIILLVASACVFRLGVQVRHWAWIETQNMHFQNDVTHAYFWGTYAQQNGLFNAYRDIRNDCGNTPPMDYGLDYAPLRLTIMTIWSRWVDRHFQQDDEWDPDKSYAFHRPLLITNAHFEAATAIGVVLVLRQMRKLAGRASSYGQYILLALAALLVWFNPALILNDCWPQWDVWILPSFVFALYCCMRGWWFAAGALLAFGAMLKGQLICIAPIFILLSLFSMQWLAAARLIAGFAVVFTLVAVPWMLHSKGDIALTCLGVALAAFCLIFRQGWRKTTFQLLAAVALLLPIWLTPKITSGDLSWFILPYTYGPIKHPEIATVGTSNLPAVLHEHWSWEAEGPDGTVSLPLPHGHTADIPLRVLLVSIYATCLVACALAASIHQRRRNPRFLLAMYAPWLLFFVLMPYLNNRYLMWAAALFPLLFPLGVGMTLLGSLICIASCAIEAEIMCRVNSDSNPTLQSLTHGLYPDLAFLLLTIAAVFLFQAMVFTRRQPQKAT